MRPGLLRGCDGNSTQCCAPRRSEFCATWTSSIARNLRPSRRWPGWLGRKTRRSRPASPPWRRSSALRLRRRKAPHPEGCCGSGTVLAVKGWLQAIGGLLMTRAGTLLKIGTICVGVVAAASAADAKGCLKGAIIGGLAGHYAVHHGLLGAAAGCYIGRH